MIIQMHLCGPKGLGQQQLLDRALGIMQLDNEMLIEAMLRDGRHVPDLVDDMGLRYVSEQMAREQARARGEAVHENLQPFYGYADMLKRGSFSCGDAAAWEAAVLTKKYGRAARAVSQPDNQVGDWHAIVALPGGTIDPVRRFLQKTGQAPRLAMAGGFR